VTPSTASRTALGASLIRALHARADPAPILRDDWGDRLVPDAVRESVREGARAYIGKTRPGWTPEGDVLDLALRANAAYADVIVRSRYAEDALEAAVRGGTDQYVIVGAGFDSFLCRRPAWAEGVTVIEVDHPATQRFKRERLAACGVVVPSGGHFVEADLSSETLEAALARSPFRRDRPAFFAWVGVTMYLPREANLATLRAMATGTSAGADVVFSYVDEVRFAPGAESDAAFERLRADVAAVGEALVSGFDPAGLRDVLSGVGLALIEDLTGPEALARYDPAGRNGLRPSTMAHLAHARTLA
jgi:methyltransferase (TIGR00027 family)